MATELDWLRRKASHLQTETMVITEDEAIVNECRPGTYRIERFGFTGNVPFRMARALQGCKVLIKTDAETEVLHLGNGYRGSECQCRYYRTTYEMVEAGA